MIHLSNVYKTYERGESAVHALRGVSLEIAEGEFVAIMGPSGSGKSTLLHILGLLDVPDSGDYKLSGQDVHTLGDNKLAEMRNISIGFVFQHFNLLSRVAALENVMLPKLYSRQRPDHNQGKKILAEVGLADRITHTPNELSGGQQQRVAIARALINKPKLILADEPTGNLDSASAIEIMEIISGLNRAGLTIVMVTHEDDIAKYARRIIHMRDGVIQKDEANDGAASTAAHPDSAEGFAEARGAMADKGMPLPYQKTTDLSGRARAPRNAGQASLSSASHDGPAAVSAEGNGWRTLLAGIQANLKQAWRALTSNKVRSALSMIGILIGVAAVIAMLAIGQGAKKSIEEQLASLGSNLLILHSGPPRNQGISMSEGMVTRFTEDDLADIRREINTVSNVAGMVQGRGQATYGGKNWSTQAIGAEPSYAAMHASVPVIGRFFTDDEQRAKARVAVIGLTLVRELFGNANPLGEFMKINKVNFQVIGVLPEKGATRFWDQDDVVIIPLTTAMDRLLGKKYLDHIEIEVGRAEDIENTQTDIHNLIIRTHRLPPSRHNSFDIRNLAEMKDALTQTSRVMAWLLSSIAAVSMLVGGIGIMNIMLVSVTERTREIGVRKAVGARGHDIMVQFLVEAMVISLVGGFIGILLGWLISLAVSTFAGWASLVTLSSIILAVSFSATIGIVFGLWPARQAARLNPIDALRYE